MCYCNGMETYELIRSGRKTLALEITRDCRVVVRAPRRLSQARIDDFVASHAGWIARHLEQQRRRAALAPSAPTQAEIGALKEKARQLQRKEQPVLLLFSHELSGCGHGPGGGP